MCPSPTNNHFWKEKSKSKQTFGRECKLFTVYEEYFKSFASLIRSPQKTSLDYNLLFDIISIPSEAFFVSQWVCWYLGHTIPAFSFRWSTALRFVIHTRSCHPASLYPLVHSWFCDNILHTILYTFLHEFHNQNIF